MFPFSFNEFNDESWDSEANLPPNFPEFFFNQIDWMSNPNGKIRKRGQGKGLEGFFIELRFKPTTAEKGNEWYLTKTDTLLLSSLILQELAEYCREVHDVRLSFIFLESADLVLVRVIDKKDEEVVVYELKEKIENEVKNRLGCSKIDFIDTTGNLLFRNWECKSINSSPNPLDEFHELFFTTPTMSQATCEPVTENSAMNVMESGSAPALQFIPQQYQKPEPIGLGQFIQNCRDSGYDIDVINGLQLPSPVANLLVEQIINNVREKLLSPQSFGQSVTPVDEPPVMAPKRRGRKPKEAPAPMPAGEVPEQSAEGKLPSMRFPRDFKPATNVRKAGESVYTENLRRALSKSNIKASLERIINRTETPSWWSKLMTQSLPKMDDAEKDAGYREAAQILFDRQYWTEQ